ncbi:MAG: lytic transglycosylase domain-containing protein [Ruminococcaceae bacterium]|nr:lytic transglycosylase domain-containing protein [Oscillospiraceae bacterium]
MYQGEATLKKAILRSIALILIIGISIAAGFIIDGICDAIDRKTHPRTYSEYVEKYSAIYDVPEAVIYATIRTESDFVSNAVSKVGAIGLMQMMPDTFKWLCEKNGESLEEGMLYDPETNIRYGTFYLSYLYSEFGLWETVYAAYNCGPGRVKEWQQNEKYADENGVLIKIPFKETSNYVKKVSKAVDIYEKLYFEEKDK